MSQNDSESDVTGGGTIFRKNKNMLSNMQKARELLHQDTFEIVFSNVTKFPWISIFQYVFIFVLLM